MTYVTYEIYTTNDTKVVNTYAEALASGFPFKTIYTAEPVRSLGGKVKGRAVSRTEYETGAFERAMRAAASRY